MPKEPMTEERLAEIMGRAEAATQGPWRAHKSFEVIYGKKSGCDSTIVCALESEDFMYSKERDMQANAAFIAHAREDIPALLDEVERLLAENERQKEVISFLGDAAKGLVCDEVERRKCEQQDSLSLKNCEN